MMLLAFLFLMMLFPVLYSPMPMIMTLFLTSLMMFFSMNIFVSTWYSYILFLVYIGGLLVLFMYVCMMSSNDKVFMKLPNLFMIFLLYILFGNFCYNISFECSNMNPLFFISLVLTLLIGFLGVLRVVGMKTTLLMNEK
uniref:NADH dehydrogenase subunit 6 n=1 Tax=Laevapex fuscus TaxID=240816 RepID=A0A8F8AFF4_9GAST|nr:NADH dehydrogenase subunit 6 [Laevapex fuscus]